jgi:hypothetical protein
MTECTHAGRVMVTSKCPRGQNKKQARKLSTQNTGNVYVVAVVDTTRMAILVNSRGDCSLKHNAREWSQICPLCLITTGRQSWGKCSGRPHTLASCYCLLIDLAAKVDVVSLLADRPTLGKREHSSVYIHVRWISISIMLIAGGRPLCFISVAGHPVGLTKVSSFFN